MDSWQLQEAKARLSEVVKKASSAGPQAITVHGERAAVLVSADDFERLSKPRGSLVQFMRKSPLFGVRLDLERDRSPNRDTDLS